MTVQPTFRAAVTPSRARPAGTAPWTAWCWGTVCAVLASMAVTTTSPLLLAVIAICTAVTIRARGRALWHPTMRLALLVVACWLVLAVLVPPRGAGGAWWTTPTWSPGPGVSLGGSMTAAGLVEVVTHALQGVDLVLVTALAAQVIDPSSAVGAARRLLGGAAPAVTTPCCLAATWSRRGCPGALRPLRLADAQARAREVEDASFRPVPAWATTTRLVIVGAAVAVPLVLPVAGVTVTGLSSLDLVILGLLVATVLTATLPPGLEPGAGSVPWWVALSALVVAVAWFGRQWLGSAGIMVEAAHPWQAPLVQIVATLTVPVCALLDDGRSPAEEVHHG